MSQTLRTRLVPFLVLLAWPATAKSVRMMPPPAGHIPDDLREVAGARGPEGLAPLKPVEHRPWLAGSSIGLLPGEREAVVADSDNGALAIVDLASGVVRARVAVGRRPERLVVAPDGRVFVTNRGSRSVSLVDPQKGVEVRTVQAGAEPWGLALTPGGLLLVASSATGELIGFDASTLAERFRLDVGPWPAAVAAHPDGKRAFVTHMNGARVDIVDLDRRRVSGELTLPDKGTGLPGRLIGRPELPRTPNLALAAVVSPGGTRLYVAHNMVDTGSARGAAVAVGGYGLSVGADVPIVSTVTTFDLETGKVERPPVERDGRDFTSFNLIAQADRVAQEMAQPVAVAVDPSRARLLLVGMGSDRVLSLDAAASDPITRPTGAFAVGEAPEGVAVTRDGSLAVVHHAHGYSLGLIRLKQPINTWTARAERTIEFAKSPLPADAQRGRRLFYTAMDQRIGGMGRFACASCHPDGRQDGMVWRIGAGPRQTPILADRLEGTAPFNWLGTEGHLTDNMKQTIRRLGGTGLTDAELSDLATYCERYMPGFDNPSRGASADLVAEGKALFESAEVGCSSCHAPDRRFTDGQRHDVGTTTALEIQIWKQFGGRKPGGPPVQQTPPTQRPPIELEADELVAGPAQPTEPLAEPPIAYNTPSLRHVWASAPYLHDGSVKSLRELLTSGNPGDRMGHTSQLTPRQVDALTAYLKTL